MNILLVGANGKMGAKLRETCNTDNFVAGIDLKENINQNIYNDFSKLNNEQIHNIDVVLDFAMPSILKKELIFCVKNKKPLVICSTGHSENELNLINLASKKIPIFKTSNTSLGIAFINKIIKENTSAISNYEIILLEKHHKLKKDSPSGTAVEFIENLKPAGEVKDISIRAGGIVGEHSIMLFSEGEEIIITHRAESRDLFAKSAIKICEFLVNQKMCGLYKMEDMFN